MAAIRSNKTHLANRNLRRRFTALVRSFSVISAIGLGLGTANCAFGQFGQTGGLGGLTGGLTGGGLTGGGLTGGGLTGGLGGQTGGQTGQAGGLGLPTGLSSGTQAGFGANPFGSGGLAQQNANPFGSLGLASSASAGTGAGTGGAGANSNLGGLTGAALTNRSLQNSFGGMSGRGGRGGQFNQNQNQNSGKPQIRATVKLGFEVAAATNATTSRLINDRLRRTPSPSLTGVTVDMVGRTAVIRGKVNSPADGKIVERFLSLEPGVDAVKNELTYATGQVPAKPQPPTDAPSGTATSASRQEAARIEDTRASSNNIDAVNAGTSAVQAAPEIVPAPGPR